MDGRDKHGHDVEMLVLNRVGITLVFTLALNLAAISAFAAEIPLDQENTFWALGAAQQTHVMSLLAGTGADVLVTESLPSTAPAGWKELGDTNYYAYRLPAP